MPLLIPPPIANLKQWDDPFLLCQEPFQNVFMKWKSLESSESTRLARKDRRHSLICELKNAETESDLQHWVDMAFNSGPDSTRDKKVTVDHGILGLFVDIQWEIFNNRLEDAVKLLRLKCRERGLGYVPQLTHGQPIPASAPPPSKASSEKRKGRVEERKSHKRRKSEATGGSEVQKATAPMAITPRAPLTGSHRQYSSNSTRKNRRRSPGQPQLPPSNASRLNTRSKSKDKRLNLPVEKMPEYSRNKSGPMDRVTLNPVQTSRSKGRKTKKKESGARFTVSSKGMGSRVNSVTDITPKVDTSDTIIDIPQDTRRVSASTPFRRPLELSHGLKTDTNNTLLVRAHPSDSMVSPMVGVDVPRIFHQTITPPEPRLVEPLSNWLQEPAEDVMTADSRIEETESSQGVVPLVCYGPPVKPLLPCYPPIWAQSRQEVCESFDWFRSYQGGVYYSRNAARGYLLSAFSASRDVFGHKGKLIISHGGGKAQSVHSHRGQSVTLEADDQLPQDKSVQALLSNYYTRRPLVLLIDDKYAQFPYDLGSKGITYAVLGFYTIVHAWAESQPAGNERGRVVRYKFAFQWCESQGVPWWLTSNKPDETSTTADMQIDGSDWLDESASPFEYIEQISNICPACHLKSAQIYAQCWTCLNPDCCGFWRDSVNHTALGNDLEYNPRFLRLAPAHSLAIPAERLEPEPPIPRSRVPTTNYAHTRGWHCKKCGRLSCRFKWERWECMHCKEISSVEGRIRPATEFLYLSPPVPYPQCHIDPDSGITLARITSFRLGDSNISGQCYSYQLPGSRGLLHHIKAGNPHLTREADGIFLDYQIQASTGELPFRRWPMRAHKCRGALLTNYFSQNAGVPYQYVGGTENTLPFDKVPDAVLKARTLIEARLKQALDKDASFNEVLSAAYMERQRMAFHTDDEIGLGPLVAGLSLGSPALMHFRLLARQVPQGTQRNIAISFVLRHGDVLAMDGAGVQQFYEHTVVPTNFRIAATARFIEANHPKHESFSESH